MSLHVTVGCMFSGKSTQALAEANRNVSIGRKVLVIKHAADAVRAGHDQLRTHNLSNYPCLTTETLSTVRGLPEYALANIVLVEEAQFFADLKEFCVNAVETDRKEVRVYGLDGTYRRRRFGQIPDLLPLATTFVKIHALCQLCGNGTPAIHTLRHNACAADGDIVVGGSDIYMPLCRVHYLTQMTKVQGFTHSELI